MRGTMFLISVVAITMTFPFSARPQETSPSSTPSVEEILAQAQQNAGGAAHPFSGYEEYYNNYYQGFQNYGGAGYGGQGPETGAIFAPDSEATNGEARPYLPDGESQGEVESLYPTDHHTSPWYQNQQAESPPLFAPDSSAVDPYHPGNAHHPIVPQGGGNHAEPSPATSQLVHPQPQNPPSFPQSGLPNNFFNFGGNNNFGGNQTSPLIGNLWQLLNSAQNGNATAGGAGTGAVQNGTAAGQGTGFVNAGLGGFGIGLGVGGAIQTPLGELAFGQGNGVAVGR